MEPIIDNENLPSAVDRQLSPKGEKWRVKVFVIDEENAWNDKGAGAAQILREVCVSAL